MDALSDVLSTIRFQSAIYAPLECRAPWGLRLPGVATHVGFIVVLRGTCVFQREDIGKPLILGGGELLLSPRGVGCTLQDAPDSPFIPIEKMSPPIAGQSIKLGADGALTSILLGCVTLDAHQRNPFIASLPGVIHLTTEIVQSEPGLEETIRLLIGEISRSGPGSKILISRLTDAVLIKAIRAFLGQIKSCPETPGWFKALTDPEIGSALNLIHDKPEAPWTVASLASAVNMSRTSFSTKFTALVQDTPIDYLTSWRMQKAIGLMQDGSDNLNEIGNSIGYRSTASFAKAFKREFGEAPGEYRRKLERLRA